MKSTRSPALLTLFSLTVLAALTFLVASLTESCADSKGPDAPRNVLLVTLDTTRADFIGAWGQPGNPTPNLDALAKDGVRFSTAVSTSALTPVSHASILTGRAQYSHGLRILAGEGGFVLPKEVPTLGSYLKQKGFSTAAYHSALPVSRLFGFQRGFDTFEDLFSSGLVDKRGDGVVGWDVTKDQRRSDVTADMVLRFLEGAEEPFALWIHFWDPHDPVLVPPAEFLTERSLEIDENGRPPLSRESYRAEISYVDQQFGRIIDALKKHGIYDDTMVVVVADHGQGLDDGMERHGWGAHRILYQEQIHVPLVVRVPGAPTGVVDDLVSAVDIFPTVLDYLDLAPPGAMEGRSLKPLINGDSETPRIAYADQINLWDRNASMLIKRPQADFLHVVMDEQYKLIYRPTNPKGSELYDYRADPGELNNLFVEKRAESIRLMKDLANRDCWVLKPFSGGEEMSEADRKRFEALGYTGTEDGSPADIDWKWLCPQEWSFHPKPGACPSCNSPTLPAGDKNP